LTGREKRRRFVRIEISRRETVISCLVLLILAGIGAAVYVKGQHYDPGLFQLDQLALSKYQPAREPPDLLKQPDDKGPRKSLDTVAPTPAGLLEALAPPGWKTLGDVQQFTADNLYEKINGRAEQYLDYKFRRLTCVSLASIRDSSKLIDVYVFDMGRPAHAFGVYAGERTEGLPAVDLGREGYRADASYFFWKGRYYVQVLAADKGRDLAQAGLAVADALEKRLADDGEPLWGLTALPEADRVPGTVQYFVTDALSLDFLKDTYIAQYNKGGAKVTAFLSRQPSPAAAAETLASYEAHLNKYGKILKREENNAYKLVAGDMGGAFDVVFRQGQLIGGVSMVESRALAEKAARDLLVAVRGRD